MYTNDGTDRVHDHIDHGFHRGCLACAQLEADFARARKTYADGSPRTPKQAQNEKVSGNTRKM